MPAISVVIPTWNGLKLLQQTIASLRGQSLLAEEVVVVDNGSDDGTAQWAKQQPDITLVRFDENRGFAAAVNAGITASSAEHVFILNNDVRCAPDCLENLAEALDRHKWADWAAPLMLNWNGETVDCAGIGVRRDFFAIPLGRGESPDRWRVALEVFGASAGACLVRRRLFEEVGLLAEEFFAYYEDVEFALRCRLAGFRCVYAPGAIVRHMGGATARRLGWRVAYLSARNQLWTMLRCCPASLIPSLAWPMFRGQLANLFIAVSEGHFWATLAGKLGALGGFLSQLRHRHRIQRMAADLPAFRQWIERPVREL